MSASQPPRLATWLLNRFISGDNRDSLMGDLVERYQRRPSELWYWRQVLVAVVVHCARDIADHKLLTARALTIGWLVYVLSSFPITWMAHVSRYWLANRLSDAGYYSFWSVFWSGQFADYTLVYLGCALSGWIVARLEPTHSAGIVSLYGASVLAFEYGFLTWMFVQHGHPAATPTLALIIPAVLVIGRPLSILVGGLWNRPDEPHAQGVARI